jgi:hypothetical protein
MPNAMSGADDSVRIKRLSTGHVALFNPATQELVLVEPQAAQQLSGGPRGNAWGLAKQLASQGSAIKLTASDLPAWRG